MFHTYGDRPRFTQNNLILSVALCGCENSLNTFLIVITYILMYYTVDVIKISDL